MSEITTYDGMHIRNPRNYEEYKVPDGLSKLVIYVLSLILPIGLATGLFYSTKPGQSSKLFGRNCLALSITPIVVSIVVLLVAFLFMTVFFFLKY